MAAALTGEDVTDMPPLDPERPFRPPSWNTRRQPSSIAVDGVRAAIDRDATWIVIIAAVLAVITVGVVIAIDRPHGRRSPAADSAADPVPPPPFAQPSPPVSVLPAPQPSTTSSALPVPASTGEPTAADHAVRRPASSPAPRPSLAPWAPGHRISLEAVQTPGYRVRHRDFRARVDRLDSTSRAADRADATFVIRAGLADAKCVSFEAVNFPGRYLRHQNFSLFLHPRSGGDLFAADATFCPVATRPGGPAVLRSVNYPGRYVVVRHSLLYLDPVPPGAATLFAARQPLQTA